jgi:RNA polymerase sigma factor (sigma-70 family)
MGKYDPAFWEISVDPETLESMLVAPDFLEELLITPEDEQEAQEKAQLKEEAIEQIRVLVQTRLTPRQRQMVEMYFYQNLTQQEIAQTLGISQQVVSKQLFGVLRDGRRVGGAMTKLRKAAEKLGVDPEKWV